jgi:hypothetical protein
VACRHSGRAVVLGLWPCQVAIRGIDFALRVGSELADPVGSLEVRQHEDVEQLGASFSSRTARHAPSGAEGAMRVDYNESCVRTVETNTKKKYTARAITRRTTVHTNTAASDTRGSAAELRGISPLRSRATIP